MILFEICFETVFKLVGTGSNIVFIRVTTTLKQLVPCVDICVCIGECPKLCLDPSELCVGTIFETCWYICWFRFKLFETCLTHWMELFDTCLKMMLKVFDLCLKTLLTLFEICSKRVWNWLIHVWNGFWNWLRLRVTVCDLLWLFVICLWLFVIPLWLYVICCDLLRLVVFVVVVCNLWSL